MIKPYLPNTWEMLMNIEKSICNLNQEGGNKMCIGKKHKYKHMMKKKGKMGLKVVNFVGKPKAKVGTYASKKDVLKY